MTRGTLPLADFTKALRLGIGRPAVYLRDHDAAPYHDALLHACLHNLAFDRQLEGSRAEYMFRLIGLSQEPTAYRNAILQALRISGDEWDALQLFDLAGLFAHEGDEGAREAMYARYRANSSSGDDTGAHQIIELDKAKGLLAVAEAIGGRPRDEEDDWEDDYLLGVAEDCGVTDPLVQDQGSFSGAFRCGS